MVIRLPRRFTTLSLPAFFGIYLLLVSIASGFSSTVSTGQSLLLRNVVRRGDGGARRNTTTYNSPRRVTLPNSSTLVDGPHHSSSSAVTSALGSGRGNIIVSSIPRGGGAFIETKLSSSSSSSSSAVDRGRGGGDGDSGEKCPMRKIGNFLASFWGAMGVVMVLLNAIRRVVPIALEPFVKNGVGELAVSPSPLTQFQLGAYILTCLWFAYVEGYKGFQLKFSPLVVSRSRTLKVGSSPFHHILLGPLYSMALFHATKKRKIVSWSVTIGVAAIVAAVKRLPYPWRNIVDAGVAVGLTWGTISIIEGYILALYTGKAPEGVDPALPEKKED